MAVLIFSIGINRRIIYTSLIGIATIDDKSGISFLDFSLYHICTSIILFRSFARLVKIYIVKIAPYYTSTIEKSVWYWLQNLSFGVNMSISLSIAWYNLNVCITLVQGQVKEHVGCILTHTLSQISRIFYEDRQKLPIKCVKLIYIIKLTNMEVRILAWHQPLARLSLFFLVSKGIIDRRSVSFFAFNDCPNSIVVSLHVWGDLCHIKLETKHE